MAPTFHRLTQQYFNVFGSSKDLIITYDYFLFLTMTASVGVWELFNTMSGKWVAG